MARILLLFSVFAVKTFVAQSYREYYELIDSARYCSYTGQYSLSDTLFSQSFSKFRGFPIDYLLAVRTHFKLTGQLKYSLLTEGFKNDLSLKETTDYLRSHNIKYNAKTLKRIFKQNHFHRQIKISALKKLFAKDQWARIKKSSAIERIDSLNFNQLMKLYSDRPNLFSRFYIGNEWQQKLSVMLLHQKWPIISPYFKIFISLAEDGKIERDFLSQIIDRNSIFGHFSFEFNKNNKLIEGYSNKNPVVCHSLGYSLLGTFSFYLKKRNEKTGHQYLVPINPTYTTDQINDLRKFIFLPPLDIALKMYPGKILLDQASFCSLITEK